MSCPSFHPSTISTNSTNGHQSIFCNWAFGAMQCSPLPLVLCRSTPLHPTPLYSTPLLSTSLHSSQATKAPRAFPTAQAATAVVTANDTDADTDTDADEEWCFLPDEGSKGDGAPIVGCRMLVA
mmetsp:Transcript_17765/g.49213  ORF Transcript_17765/g.49213 Transcript_17765/m.49213 type:complete len:124 (-) Transcript_17765:1774-2145(-)